MQVPTHLGVPILNHWNSHLAHLPSFCGIHESEKLSMRFWIHTGSMRNNYRFPVTFRVPFDILVCSNICRNQSCNQSYVSVRSVLTCIWVWVQDYCMGPIPDSTRPRTAAAREVILYIMSIHVSCLGPRVVDFLPPRRSA